MREFLRRLFSNVFGVLGVLSSVCLVIGVVVAIAGTLMDLGSATWAAPMKHFGFAVGDIGFLGLALFGWLYARSERKKREDRFKVARKDWKDSVLH